MTSQLSTLTNINAQDFLAAWGLDKLRFGQSFFRALARPSASAFARELIAYDEAVGEGGLPRGGQMLLKRYTAGLRVAGREHIPASGPALILSNHPGLSDTVALFAAIARTDLRVLGLDRAFLRALPNTARQMFLMPDDAHGRIATIRTSASFLRKGGALLTFPAGQIEPDPLVLPGAVESLSNWSESIGVFARLAPQTQIIAAIVSGVLTPEAQRNPVIRIQRDQKKREFLGATLQILWKGYRRNYVHVAFAKPLPAADLVAQNPDPARVTAVVVEAARQLITDPPSDWETIL
jgi:hypothetical protein